MHTSWVIHAHPALNWVWKDVAELLCIYLFSNFVSPRHVPQQLMKEFAYSIFDRRKDETAAISLAESASMAQARIQIRI